MENVVKSGVFTFNVGTPIPTIIRTRKVEGGPKDLLERMHKDAPIGADCQHMSSAASMKQTLKRLMTENPGERYAFVIAPLAKDDRGNNWCHVWKVAPDDDRRVTFRHGE